MNKKLYNKVLLSVCISAALATSTPVFSQNMPNVKNLVLSQLDFNNLPMGKFKDDFDSLNKSAKKRAQDWLDRVNTKEHDLPFLHVTEDGSVYFADNFPETVSTGAVVEPNTTLQATSVSNVFKLHSKPNSTKTIYIDFDGHLISGTAWSGVDLNAVAYDTDGDATTFSDTEKASIVEIWRRIAEDYAPFDIDVTTEEPASFDRNTGRILITKDVDANGVDMPARGAGGVAFLDVFGDPSYATTYSPTLVYYNNLGGGRADYVAEAASHEMGHNMGLSHDTSSTSEYYTGQGTGDISWGPIMGASYGRNVTQWSKGDYPDAGQTEDDVAIIASKTNYINDDHADIASQATPLSLDANGNVVATTPVTDPNNTLPANKGVINTPNDIDVFSFTTIGGDVVLQASPLQEPTHTNGGNLDIALSLYDASGNLIADSKPANTTDAGINTAVTAGTYYLHVQDDSSANYTTYGSVGQYFIDGTIPVLNDTTAPTPDPMNWATAPQAVDRFSISMTSATATDDNSDVEYYFSCDSDSVACTDSTWQSSPTYTATGLQAGTSYSFKVKARDASGNETAFSPAATATTRSNTAPVANDDTAEVYNTSTVDIDVLANDTDADGDNLSINNITVPNNGSVTEANGIITYTPNANYIGEDSFSYTISDGNGGNDVATVTIKVMEEVVENTPPKARFDHARVKQKESVVIDVLSNDSDADGDDLEITSVTQGRKGVVSIEDNQIIYTADNHHGWDSFTYTVSDGKGGTAIAKVRVIIQRSSTRQRNHENDDKDEKQSFNSWNHSNHLFFER